MYCFSWQNSDYRKEEKTMTEFIIQNWAIILAVLVASAVVAVIIYLAATGKKEIIYKMIYALVDEAERLYGSKAGKMKFAYVMEKVYAKLPAFFRLFISYNILESWIEKALAEAKIYWAEQIKIAESAEESDSVE